MIPGIATITALVKAAVVAVTPYLPAMKTGTQVVILAADVAGTAKKVKEARVEK